MKTLNKRVAVVNTLANIYLAHRKFKRLFSRIKIAEGSNIFLSPSTLLIGTILKRIGCTVKIYNDFQNEINPNEINEDFILISSMTSSSKRAYEIAKLFPDRKVIMGGIHVSALPEEAAKYSDHVVVGECENILPDLISGNIKEKIVYGEKVQNLDSLPFLDFSLLKKQPGTLPIQTSRGCNYKCNFCTVPNMYGRYRYRSPESIITELLNFRERYGEIKKIDFRIDADFAFKRKRAIDIFSRMKSEEIKPKIIAANSRLEVFKDVELMNLMSEQNVTLCIGIESLNQDVLNYYNKGQRESEIIDAIRVFHDYNIKILGYFLFGAEQDDKDTLKKYSEFIHKSKLDFFHVSIVTPYPGTGLQKHLLSQKRIFTTDWKYYDGLHITFKPAKMTSFEMQKEFFDFYQREFSLITLLNPALLLNFEKLRNRFFISFLNSIFKKDIIEYLSFLETK